MLGLRLDFESGTQEGRNVWRVGMPGRARGLELGGGGVGGELRAASCAMRGLRQVFELRMTRICAECFALKHARCRGCDWCLTG